MDTSSQYGQQNFSLPHDVVKLPSNGVFYKSKKKSIKVGYLTAADENLLMAGGDYGKDGLIMTLLRNKIYEPEIKPDEVLSVTPAGSEPDAMEKVPDPDPPLVESESE